VEIKNESMRVLKAKEVKEVDQKVEKDMIELTILEATENIEKYQKETKAWTFRADFSRSLEVLLVV
jgi:hypothetical protein